MYFFLNHGLSAFEERGERAEVPGEHFSYQVNTEQS